MTHPIFRKEIFVETAFEKRFQAMLRSAWHKRSWHVIVADPGAGKTMGIRDLIKTAGSKAVLAITAPKNNEDEMALGNQLFTALGMPLRGRWSDRKPKLMGHLHQYGTECLIVDDAHDLSLEHLMFIKELTDQGRLQYDHPLGLCLVAAGRGTTIPLKETLDLPDPTWLQFRRRLDKLEPFCRVAGHASEEVREILATLETMYQQLFPQLNLRQWAGSIYTWLTQPVLDPTHSGRVTMDYLMKLVTTALEWTYEAGETDVQTGTLEKAAQLLVLRRDTLQIIDGAGPSVEVSRPDRAEPGSAHGTEQQQETVRANGQQNTAKTVEAQVQTSKSPKCTFSGVVAIDLKRFADSGVALVECPDCSRMRSLSPHKGVLRFPSHDRRKMQTPVTGVRWAAKGKTDWGVVGGEKK
jgi:DNA transposition AAA+ family ATPase